MKKVILLTMVTAVSLVSFIKSANAQKGFYVSAHGAPQLSVMFNKDDIGKPNSDYRSKFSGTFGIGAGYKFTDQAGVGTEVRYSVASQRYILNDKEYTQHFDYLKIPVLFIYNGNPKSMITFTAKAGPQLGVLLKSKITDADDQSLNGTTKNQYQRLTAGAMAGAGARMRVASNIYLDAGLRFDGTFTNTENKNYKGYVQGRANTYDLNTGLDFGIKYYFN